LRFHTPSQALSMLASPVTLVRDPTKAKDVSPCRVDEYQQQRFRGSSQQQLEAHYQQYNYIGICPSKEA
jgi:hypothetical protein